VVRVDAPAIGAVGQIRVRSEVGRTQAGLVDLVRAAEVAAVEVRLDPVGDRVVCSGRIGGVAPIEGRRRVVGGGIVGRREQVRRRRGDVADVDGGGVFAEAAVLVGDPRLDGVVGGAVVVAAGRGVVAAGAGVGAGGEVAVGAAVGVVEACRGVGRARVELVREGDRGRAAFEIGSASCRERGWSAV